MDPAMPRDLPPVAPGGGGPMPSSVVEMPPQMFTTAAQLLDLTDKKLMVSLRDGRKLIGVLRSWDQFANLVLQDTVERIFVQKAFADVPRGLFLVRGENVLLLGEIDLDRDDEIPATFEKVSPETVLAMQRTDQAARRRRDKLRLDRLQALGFESENMGETLL